MGFHKWDDSIVGIIEAIAVLMAYLAARSHEISNRKTLVLIFRLLCNSTGTRPAPLPKCLPNCRATRSLDHPISRFRDFARFGNEWFHYNNTHANPSKFEVITITGGYVTTPVTFNIRNIDLPVNENVKVLGIHIDSKLKFDKHISELCKSHRVI